MRCLNQLEHLAADAERARLERQQLAAASQKIVETVPLENIEINDTVNFEETHQQIAPRQPTRQERPRARTGGT